MNIDPFELTRVTLVDETGRIYERWGLVVSLSVQDNGRTLKVFIAPRDQPTSLTSPIDKEPTS